jgi:integrase
VDFRPSSGRLFSYFKDTPGKKAAQRASRWFTGYRRSIGLDGEFKDFHSFRHTFISAARIVMAEENYVQITGHKSEDRVNRAYGTYSLAKLKQEIDKVDWAI